MNIYFKQLLLLTAITITLIACGKDDEDENIEPSYKSVSEDTQTANLFNGGFAAGDEDAIYFYHFDNEGVKLYSKKRQTGLLTVLDEIANPELVGADMLYSDIQIVDDYIYYMPFDTNDDDKEYYVWRMKKDGSEKKQITSRKTYQYRIYREKIYYTVLLGEESFYSINLDGTGEQKISGFCPVDSWLRNGKLYYYDMEEFQFFVRNVDGSGTPEFLFEYQNNFTYVVAEDGTLYCMDIDLSDCKLLRIDPTTKESKILMTGIPFGSLNVSGNTIFIACGESNNNYQAGIYRYEDGYKMLMPVLKVATSNIAFVGNDQIVYANANDKENAGRFSQLYLTDFNGSFNKKIME